MFYAQANNVIMTKTTTIKWLLLTAFICFTTEFYAQGLLDIGEKYASDTLTVTSLRSKTSISIGAGAIVMNGDLSDPDFENFLKLQLKHFISPRIAISGNLKKFDIDNYDFKDQGFLSGDLNAEWYILPNQKFTPYVFAGPGLLISNDFDDKNYKVQGGIGLEFLLSDCLALFGSLEANYIYDEQKGSMLLQEADQLYYNATIGISFYFGDCKYSKNGKSKKRLSENAPSIIKSNTIGYY